jgi:hypothetical protein
LPRCGPALAAICLFKGAGQVEIVQSIQAVARGEAVFGPAVANRVLAYFSGPPPAPAEAFPELTEREREVLELLARGELNAAIARRLGLREHSGSEEPVPERPGHLLGRVRQQHPVPEQPVPDLDAGGPLRLIPPLRHPR